MVNNFFTPYILRILVWFTLKVVQRNNLFGKQPVFRGIHIGLDFKNENKYSQHNHGAS